MQSFEGVAAARDALQDFYYSNKGELPEHVTGALAPLFRTGTSPVDAIVKGAEAIYANQAELPAGLKNEALLLAAALSDVRDREGYHLDQEPNRASRMRNAMRRAAGESAPGKDSNNPAPLAEFAPPAAEEEAEAPAGGQE